MKAGPPAALLRCSPRRGRAARVGPVAPVSPAHARTERLVAEGIIHDCGALCQTAGGCVTVELNQKRGGVVITCARVALAKDGDRREGVCERGSEAATPLV